MSRRKEVFAVASVVALAFYLYLRRDRLAVMKSASGASSDGTAPAFWDDYGEWQLAERLLKGIQEKREDLVQIEVGNIGISELPYLAEARIRNLALEGNPVETIHAGKSLLVGFEYPQKAGSPCGLIWSIILFITRKCLFLLWIEAILSLPQIPIIGGSRPRNSPPIYYFPLA